MAETFDVSFDLERRRGIARFQAVCRGQDMLGAMGELFDSPHWELTFDSVWDFTPVRALDLQLGDVESMLSRSRRLTSGGQSGRVAIVVALEDQRVMAKLMVVRMAKFGREARMFPTLAKAEAWLDGV